MVGQHSGKEVQGAFIAVGLAAGFLATASYTCSMACKLNGIRNANSQRQQENSVDEVQGSNLGENDIEVASNSQSIEMQELRSSQQSVGSQARILDDIEVATNSSEVQSDLSMLKAENSISQQPEQNKTRVESLQKQSSSQTSLSI